MKVILDTNVWLSGIFWHGKPGIIVNEILGGKNDWELVVSGEGINELREKLTKRGMGRLVSKIDALCSMVNAIDSRKEIVRDPKDQMWVDLCIASRVDYLVTGDKDLLVLKKIGKTKVIKPGDFLLGINNQA